MKKGVTGMRRSMVARSRRMLLLLPLCLIVALFAMAPVSSAHAQETDQKVVRVGWYDSAFHHVDDFGRRSGYGYEYQQRVATYTGWTYEYVEGSWSELFEMLAAGDIDLLSDVSFTEERAQKILFSSEKMGSEDYHAFITPTNTDIRPDDFSTFNGKRVGVNKNSIQEKLFVEWASSHGVTPEVVELTAKTPELLAMLERGDIDALVTLDTYGNSADVVPVCKVGSSDFFFGINRNRPDLKQELDIAMSRILEDNRDFNQQMAEKHNKASAVNSFLTPEEKEWVNAHGAIRVGYRDNYLPFCGTDERTKTLTGALADYLTFAETCEKNAQLSFETRGFSTTEQALQALAKGEIDCVFPLSLSAYDGEQRGIILTDPLVTTEMYASVRTADQQGVMPDQKMTVAIIEGNPNFESFIRDNFPSWNVEYFSTSSAACQAVASGKADYGLMSSYRINGMRELLDEYGLSVLATGETMDMSFAVNREDDCLYSILNKINRLMPKAEISSSLTTHSFVEERVTPGEFLRDNLPLVVAVIGVIAVVILLLLMKNARSKEEANEGRQLISEAERDPLTQLYNRNFFIVYVSRFYRENPQEPMDAIVVNIERFHALNSLHGRDFGDEVLRALGDEIGNLMTETQGVAGRVAGDHFDIYCTSREDYQELLNRLQSRMDALSDNADIRLRMGVMPWQKGVGPEQMFNQAWSACGMVRGDYKSHLMVYDEEMRQRDDINQRLQNDLGRALEEHELEVYYQPKYDIRSDEPKLHGAEALVRWRHPQYGMLPPNDFVPLFERSGQISAMDKYVWKEAARQIAAWRDKYGVTLPVSVNLSRVDVFDPSLLDTLDGLVQQYGLERKYLQLEITESAYTENADQLIRIIGQLRDKGYEIEMDDFGSGYSSLNMLSSMPIDVLKMDIGFIRNIEHDEKEFRFVELIVDIADNLQVPVIAEDVENEAQLALLKSVGCSIVQGYYFSCPLPVDEFERSTFEGE